MTVRAPAVAGSFYPAAAAELAADVDAHLAAGRGRLRRGAPPPKVLIAPHAGYRYSGPIAGTAYATLDEAAAPRVHRVVLVGPAHRVRVAGIAASTASAFATPLGAVPVERAPTERLVRDRRVADFDLAHAAEHSLEVQLPFLQRALSDFSIVPLVVGAAAMDDVAEVLTEIWGGPETLIVISSDLSHYHDYDTAVRLDAEAADAIVRLEPERLDSESACGRIPIGGLLLAAATNGLRAQLLDLRNSGDTAGPRDEVVGYGAFAFA